MRPDKPEQYPLATEDAPRTKEELEALVDEIREEAYRIYRQHLATGTARGAQDDWIEAMAAVRARHHMDA